MSYPSDTFQEAVELSIAASNQLHQILNGDSTTEVTVEDGSKIPSVRKAYIDSLFFLSPQPWSVGEYETVYNQLRAFVEPTGITTWWFSKTATISTPILMSTTPHEDTNWTLWNALNNSVYETQKRLAAEAGLNMVGSFLLGATITDADDVVFYETDGKYYGWGGTLPKTVLSGSTPTTTGGIDIGAWSSKVDLTLRGALVSSSGASLILTSEETSVQSKLNNIDIELPLKADKTQVDLRVGTAGALTLRNKIVDGRFDFWYEGTSKTALTNGYGSATMVSDSCQSTASGFTRTISQQPLVSGVDLPSVDCPSAKYFYRTLITDTLADSTAFGSFNLPIEDVGTLAGKTANLSFYAKADAAKSIGIEFYQCFGSGGSSDVITQLQQLALSTTWKRYTVRVQIPSISGKTLGAGHFCAPIFWLSNGSKSGLAGRGAGIGQQAITFDIACVQLEEGTVATQFEELPIDISKCRLNRYFEQGILFVPGYSVLGSSIGAVVKYSLQKMVLPSISLTIQSPSNCSTFGTTSSDTNQVGIYSQVLATGFAQFWCNWKADARL